MKKLLCLLVAVGTLMPLAGGGGIYKGGHSDGYDSTEYGVGIFRGGHSDGYAGFDAAVAADKIADGSMFSVE